MNQHSHIDCANWHVLGERIYNRLYNANRFGGNSLLGCRVMARLSAQEITENVFNPDISYLQCSTESACNLSVVDVQKVMWDYIGIVCFTDRSKKVKTLFLSYKEQLDCIDDNKTYIPSGSV